MMPSFFSAFAIDRKTTSFPLDKMYLLDNDVIFYISARLRYYSDFKLGINIPARGETSDLLKTDGEKNDYDW